jgi:hypothetical protein
VVWRHAGRTNLSFFFCLRHRGTKKTQKHAFSYSFGPPGVPKRKKTLYFTKPLEKTNKATRENNKPLEKTNNPLEKIRTRRATGTTTQHHPAGPPHPDPAQNIVKHQGFEQTTQTGVCSSTSRAHLGFIKERAQKKSEETARDPTRAPHKAPERPPKQPITTVRWALLQITMAGTDLTIFQKRHHIFQKIASILRRICVLGKKSNPHSSASF